MTDKVNPLDILLEDEVILKKDKKSYVVKDWYISSIGMQFFVVRKCADEYELGMWVDANKISKIVNRR